MAEPDKFKVGMGIRVSDDNSKGFTNTVATIVGKHCCELIINRMLNHDYCPSRNGRAVSVYPVVSGYYLNNAGISNLTIDGNSMENEYIDGCRGGGIFLLQCHNFVVRQCNGQKLQW